MDISLDHIAAWQRGEILVLEITATTLNDFDLAHATANEIETALSKCESKKAVLSLKNVDYVTSVGLIIFARLISYTRQAGMRVVLCDAKQEIAQVLEVTRLVMTETGPNDKQLLLKPNQELAFSELT